MTVTIPFPTPLIESSDSVFRDLADYVWKAPNVGDRNERCRLLLNLSGAALPIARAHIRVGQTDAGLAMYEAIIEAARKEPHALGGVADVVRPHIIAEIKEAIAASIARRPT